MSDVVDLACQLIARASVTPDDAGCQSFLIQRLEQAGFHIENLPSGNVKNLWATHGEDTGPTLMFLGHTDVVPPGPEKNWQTPPFMPTLSNGVLYGRGAADMKGSVAAMVVALERFVTAHPNHAGRVGLLLTSDEEGPAIDGVREVAKQFAKRHERLDWCVVGEPSAKERLGDLIRVGRRGSLSAKMRVTGLQGHVAYPDQAINPIHKLAPAMTALLSETWDEGNTDFPPTSLQFSNIHAGTGANNVIPGELEVDFNFRYSTECNEASLRTRTEAILDQYRIEREIAWHDSGRPFLSPPDGKLRQAVVGACQERLGMIPEQSTGGGTSDGRFIAPLGVEVVELGPVNATIHKINECVRVDAIENLSTVYETLCLKCLV